MLVDLEVAQVLGGGRVGRALEEGGKPLDVAHILMLGPGRQAAHHHVVLHPLAQRTDRGGRGGSHGKFLALNGLAWSDGGLSPPKAYDYHATSNPGDPPAERVRAWRRDQEGKRIVL